MISIFRSENLLQWSWVSMIGPDARDFLNRLSTVDARVLEPGLGRKGFFLSPQGKIRSYFTLWCYGAEEFAFEFDAGVEGRWKADLLALIDQYTFAEKYTLTDVGQLGCIWIFADINEEVETLAPGLEADQTRAIDRGLRLCHHGKRDFGRVWISVWGRPAQLAEWEGQIGADAREASPDTLEEWRILALSPRTGQEVTENANPLELGLSEGLASGKGCYPGQEVIEKIISLGSPARRLVRVEFPATIEVPSALPASLYHFAEAPIEIGQLTSLVVPLGKAIQSLALVKKIYAKEGMQVQLGQKSGIRGTIVQI